jgi:hypothetical protein
MIVPRPTTTTSTRRQHRRDHRPQLITEHVSANRGTDLQTSSAESSSDTP